MIPLAELIRQKIGVRVQKLTRDLAEQFGFQPGSGLLISEVESDGPAARVDLQPGFLIAGIDGQSTTDLLSAASRLAGKKKGERTELTVFVHQRRAGFSRVSQAQVAVPVR
jgi:serine protease Do